LDFNSLSFSFSHTVCFVLSHTHIFFVFRVDCLNVSEHQRLVQDAYRLWQDPLMTVLELTAAHASLSTGRSPQKLAALRSAVESAVQIPIRSRLPRLCELLEDAQNVLKCPRDVPPAVGLIYVDGDGMTDEDTAYRREDGTYVYASATKQGQKIAYRAPTGEKESKWVCCIDDSSSSDEVPPHSMEVPSSSD
jgi:hypothetical protein